LESLIKQGRFRKDLYYRLNVMSLHIPPLRERPEDIAPLAGHLLTCIARKNGFGAIHINAAAVQALSNHSWQGNVRELANVLERAMLTIRGDEIQPTDLPFSFRSATSPASEVAIQPIRSLQADLEREAILGALRKTGNNKAEAASLLGIHRTQLYKKLKKYGLSLKAGLKCS